MPSGHMGEEADLKEKGVPLKYFVVVQSSLINRHLRSSGDVYEADEPPECLVFSGCSRALWGQSLGVWFTRARGGAGRWLRGRVSAAAQQFPTPPLSDSTSQLLSVTIC